MIDPEVWGPDPWYERLWLPYYRAKHAIRTAVLRRVCKMRGHRGPWRPYVDNEDRTKAIGMYQICTRCIELTKKPLEDLP